jgi:hypothetical protein
MMTYIQALEAKREARERFDEIPREPSLGTKHAACLLAELLECHGGRIPSKVVLTKAQEQSIKRFHLLEAKCLLRLRAVRINLHKTLLTGKREWRGAGFWLTVATQETPAAIERLLAPPHATPEPEPPSEDEQALLFLHDRYMKGKLKSKTVRLPDRTIHDCHIHASIFFSISEPKTPFIQEAVSIARALGKK